MVELKKFISIQVLLWIIVTCSGIYTVINTFQSYSAQTQLTTQRAISLYIRENPLVEEPKVYGNNIKKIFNLDSLKIQKDKSEVIYNQNENLSYLPFTIKEIHALSPFIRTQFAVDADQGLNLEFTVKMQLAATVAQNTLFTLMAFTLILVITPFLTLKSTLKKASDNVTEAMSKMVDQFVKTDEQNKQLDSSIADGAVSSIFPSIVRLNSFLRKKQKEVEESALEIKFQAYKDSVTDLGNRNMFVEYYGANIEDTDKPSFGILALVRSSELQLINQTRGYQKGDEYIKEVSNLIQKVTGTYSTSQCYRINSSDFAIILPNIPLKEAEKFGDSLQSKFTEYQQQTELSSIANTGMVAYEAKKPLGELLALVDTALSLAQSKQANAWHIQKASDVLDNVSASFGNQNWRQVIDDVLENSRVKLMIQTISPTNRSTKAYSEILARFKTNDDQILPTASFLAMSEKLGQISHVDKLIIESAIDSIKNKNLSEQFFGINITAHSAHDEQFVIWLERLLLKNNNVAAKLIFEISEFGLQQNIKASKRFIDMTHRVGSRVTVERFGVGLTSFKFFRDLKPDFIKMDASYTRGLEEDKNNQYFMRLIVDLAHRIGVTVLAEGVETQEEKHIIEQLCLDGAQGYYIDKPRDI
ncbi:GGDEF domain-containing protein [Pseudoalteromonas sp. C2R02]|uniref:EAL domain-containing protein n=1 Tax=Pseudoalteromonas sp. C2R02 TaxID=2841565 RepID=UPI001C09DA73|nr:GGDEF domain-containing protein [Pseudoalteromonas sp. C2R02]MBU2971916.1 GGDEF domain-containing protein [Pseudoalteromonas sp. C2R02]